MIEANSTQNEKQNHITKLQSGQVESIMSFDEEDRDPEEEGSPVKQFKDSFGEVKPRRNNMCKMMSFDHGDVLIKHPPHIQKMKETLMSFDEGETDPNEGHKNQLMSFDEDEKLKIVQTMSFDDADK